jgi:signal transduction histidine kinase/dihydroneopterin aldolase
VPSEVSTISGVQSVEELRRELAEAREQQTATAEILASISSSVTDANLVFAKIAASAARLCDAHDATIFQVDGDDLRIVAHDGPIPPGGRLHLTRAIVTGCAVLDRRTIHVADLHAESDKYPESSNRARFLGYRTILVVPLIHSDEAIGVISIRRTEVRPFTDRQIDLLKSFADQAVIAIENTRLFEAEQARTKELQTRSAELAQSLEYQTAISNVLNIISRSPTQLQPVLDEIASTAANLCEAGNSIIMLEKADELHLVAAYGLVTSVAKGRIDRGWTAGRAFIERRPVHVYDLLAAPDEFPLGHLFALRSGHRTTLGIPLLREGKAIGCLFLGRTVVQPFSEKQIALLQTFADQAVIAIENTRLFEEVQARTRELTESLQQQTATADVLKVISRSALDVQKVLDALVESAARLCNALDAAIYQVFGDGLRLVAHHGPIPVAGAVPLSRGVLTARAVIDRRTMHVEDLRSQADEYPESQRRALQHGYRTLLAVPLVHAGEAIGAILIRRAEALPFTNRQIDLVNTFADQAVIAIENTRLFEAEQTRTRELTERTRELAEALEYQTATSDVLAVISQSKFDLQPVLDAIAKTASRLCVADDVVIHLREDEHLRLTAHYGRMPTAFPKVFRQIGRDWVAGRTVVDREPVHVPDLQTAGDDFPLGRDIALRAGHRTTLGIPLLREDNAVGCLMLRRPVVRPFSEKQIAILKTFADQAVIAIENTRLFEEIAQKSRELEIASQHKSQFVANMSHELRTPLAAMLGYAELLQEGIYGAPPEKFLPILTRIQSNGKHLLGLINTVLDISKIEAGQFKLNLAEYALGSIVETVMVATESLAATKKLAFKTDVAKGLPYGVGDEQRLTQVLLNLVGNAIKFTDAGQVCITAGAANGHFVLSVSDTGPGIPAEECEHIFEKFRQVDSSNTRAKGGTGLGLAIAREIVEMHGGRIWVESTLGQGSTFRMELPVRAPVAAGAA